MRMLVPLVDMINHAGDCGGALMPGKEYVCQDVAVWELLPPPQSRSGAWEMIVKAIRPARDGQEVRPHGRGALMLCMSTIAGAPQMRNDFPCLWRRSQCHMGSERTTISWCTMASSRTPTRTTP